MRTKILFLVAMFFLAISIFSCKKDKQELTPNQDESLKQAGFFCPYYGYDFQLVGNNGFSKTWKISNYNPNDRDLYFTCRSYDGLNQQDYWFASRNVQGWGEITTQAFRLMYDYPRVYSIYLPQAESLDYCLSTGKKEIHYESFNHEYKTDIYGNGYWEVTGIIENNDDDPTKDWSDYQGLLKVWNNCNNDLLLKTPIRVTGVGIPYKTQMPFKLIIEEEIFNGVDANCLLFNPSFDNNYPN